MVEQRIENPRVAGSIPSKIAAAHRCYSLNPYGPVAQLVEQRIENPRVSGSIPLQATIFIGSAVHNVLPISVARTLHGLAFAKYLNALVN